MLKPQDLLVLLWLVAHPGEAWSYAGAAAALRMISAEVHAALKRASRAGLYSPAGRSGIAHVLLGTVAGDVLREVACDVLVVPGVSRAEEPE